MGGWTRLSCLVELCEDRLGSQAGDVHVRMDMTMSCTVQCSLAGGGGEGGGEEDSVY